MLYLAEKLNYINTNQKNELLNSCNEISKIIRGLINVLKTKK
jgi:four helix bundle protein